VARPRYRTAVAGGGRQAGYDVAARLRSNRPSRLLVTVIVLVLVVLVVVLIVIVMMAIVVMHFVVLVIIVCLSRRTKSSSDPECDKSNKRVFHTCGCLYDTRLPGRQKFYREIVTLERGSDQNQDVGIRQMPPRCC